MTIFGSHVGCHIPNIEYLKVYEGIWSVWENMEGICVYMKVYGGIWKHMGVYGGISSM